ENEAISN
ncbi:hypothetical protein CISIN_1g0437191mg, partial [Citrus sinensis]